MSNASTRVPPGTYFLGDPCYVVADQDWNEFLDCMREEQEWRGRPLAAFNTKYGDGSYRDGNGNEYCVDSGIIGLVHASLIGKRRHLGAGRIVQFLEETDCTSCDQKGTMRFGKIRIRTG